MSLKNSNDTIGNIFFSFFLVTLIQCFMLHSLYILLYDDTFKCVETLRLRWLSCYFADVIFHVSYPCLASARQFRPTSSAAP